MRVTNGNLAYSPSDVTAYLECEHLTQLELKVVRGEIVKPQVEDAQAELIRRKGEEHERAYLDQLLADGRDVVTIELVGPNGEWDWEGAARETADAMHAGREVVYQAAFLDGEWRGLADFVIRGADGSYEAYDTKLARHGKPAHVLQLCFYSEQIGRVQGRTPERMHIALGSGETESYRVLDFLAYYRRVRGRFLDAVHNPRLTEPWPVDHCSMCDFRKLCEARWDEQDHLTRVANIRRDQIVRLGEAGITTLAALGDTPPETVVPHIAASTLENIRHQAELQLRHRRTGEHAFDTLRPEDERGLALLPKPSPGDLFFDMEGDPYWEPTGGLEYLFGVLWHEDGEEQFRGFWAHDREEERRAFEDFMDFVRERLERQPDLHVYHYASYEQTALKRLMGEYATCEDAVDNLLRREVLVDLLDVVRQGVRISHPRYGLKDVEQFYMEREAELSSGEDSIVLYERWVDGHDQSILDGIEEYNREDCLSTYLLREWLIARKADAQAAWGTQIPWREPPAVREIKPEDEEELAERETLREVLLVRGDESARLAGLLLEYHKREAKPVWWAFFRRLELTSSELVEDSESIGGLEWDGEEPEEHKQSRIYTGTFPTQPYKLGDEVVDPATGKSAGTIYELDDAAGRLRLRRGPKLFDVALPQALIPGGAWDTSCQRQALMRLGRSVRADDGRYAALEGVIRRELPLEGARVQVETEDEMKELVDRVEGRHLFIQGPPGSGKTYTGARLIAHLLGRGKRVGVASTTHKAIHNLLDEIVEVGVTARGLKKSSSSNPEAVYEKGSIESESDVKPFLDPEVRLLAGTAWLFARPELDQQLDYLFIDEAGQVSHADALAMGTSARTLVLLGDPVQLAQVSQGTHPGGSGASVLEHLLGDAQTIPVDRGLFLDRSFRMHPDVCRYISDAFYESRLEPADGCERQSTSVGTGLRFLAVEHEGNRRSSAEEAARVGEELERLLGEQWTDKEGVTRPLGLNDILVVAPYNEQVKCLAEALPRGARVGTVDKFQGQEAPVTFFSMATSSAAYVPRNLEFLLSRNRLNVAVSRAKCLAYVVASPKLLEVGCRSIEQMRMANALCLFVEGAGQS
ncbi:MAG TPA: TM0106 family RecB-like putative nuclease [Gaiellaceae bacterium]|nr:TM0106 family RecB-like putative nuclease [Gaiellaceae bacterium]